jgi:polysaccharide biosynthesis protein PelG
VIQATISLLCVILAPRIFEWLGISYLQLGIFRFGVIGAFFHVLFLCLTIILSYFELRKQVLWLTVFFVASNAVFTWYSLQHGFSYYGYGYFASALLTFLFGAMVTFRELGRIPYHTFNTQPPTARAAPEDQGVAAPARLREKTPGEA